jgi:4-amino-4-deoxy-L-arabinose transferase-like glycosyltransferase
MDHTAGQQRMEERSRRRERPVVLCSIAALVWVLAARVLGPSDAWDQAQPRTISCTTDIIANGNWILPLAGEAEPATKPPLYNWLAVPAVALMGLSSEMAHKAPSLAALCLCWAIVVAWGRRFDPAGRGLLGWLAAMCLMANYPFFKLGYLARPDMLLVLWVLVGWCACTVLLIDARSTREHWGRRMTAANRMGIALVFWCCVGLAGLTKGPAALPLLVYAVVAAPLVGGRWSVLTALQPWWGLPVSLAIFGAWVWAAWRIDPVHMVERLWGIEVFGRVIGRGPESSGTGPIGVLTRVTFMPLYYLGFFFPWSFASIAAAVRLHRRPAPSAPRRWHALGSCGAMLRGAAVFVVVTLVLYSLSASKRADYIAVAYAPGALLAAWWLLEAPGRLAAVGLRLAPVAAALVLAAHTVVNEMQPNAPQRGVGDVMRRFCRDAETHLQADPAPVVFRPRRYVLPHSYFGGWAPGGKAEIRRLLEEQRAFWLFASQQGGKPHAAVQWLSQLTASCTIAEVCRSVQVPATDVWPEQMILYRVEPKPR